MTAASSRNSWLDVDARQRLHQSAEAAASSSSKAGFALFARRWTSPLPPPDAAVLLFEVFRGRTRAWFGAC